ncbi:energy transducer TonB [Salinimicrobium flavum]|uniref:Energy transducer TonB n=1 Tax=Salinimicrobium flavum TaxID=1737065 RepID=A0ABW5IVR2_9FLAO
MKTLFVFLCFFLFSYNTFAQQETYTLVAVDEAPFIKECYDPNKDSKECFNQNLSDFLQSNLVTPKTVKGEGKAYATFHISETGAISDVKVKATDKDQEEEVIRVLSSLKIASPAKLDGKAVAVTHALPVIFKQTMYDSYGAFFDTRAKNLPNATKTAFSPLFEACIPKPDKSSCFQETLEKLIAKSVKAKSGTVLNYYLEINKNAEAENVLVLSHNDNNASKQAKAFLETLSLEAPARNEQKKAVKSFFYGKLVL